MAWQPMLQGHHFELHHHIIKNNNNFKNIKKKSGGAFQMCQVYKPK